jgi:vancomycin resistance protein YoaR
MKRIIKYGITALLCAAAVFMAVKFVNSTLADGMDNYVNNINTEVEAKRRALLSDGTFREGIMVNDIPIGGMTYNEAKKALEPVEKELVGDIGFKVEYGDNRSIDFGKDFFYVSYNTAEILQEAILLANDGEFEALRQQIDDLKKNGKNYEIDCKVSADINRIASIVKEAGDSLNVDPVNASFQPNPNSVTDGGDRFTYVDGKNGYRAKTDEAVAEIVRRAQELDYGTVKIDGEVIEPDVTKDMLQGRIVRRSVYKSSYSHSPYDAPNRVANIIKACGIVNGTVIEPKSWNGYVFSINKKLGKRTADKGWLPAPGFVDSGARSVDSPGGGVCHVSSTLYNAVIKADLEIVYRINHSSHVGYVPWGQDATIDSNGPDFKFANNTKDLIYVFMWVDQKKQKVCCEIWGTPFPSSFDKIEFYAELLEEIPPTEMEYKTDRTLQPNYWYIYNNAKTGYKYQSYKQYYKNDKPVGAPVKVATSTYRMHPKRIAVWPGFNPAVDYLDPAYKIDPPGEENNS